MANKTVKVTQVKSSIGRLPKHKATLRGLGLGGQMPMQRRLPKFGFTSRKSLVSTEVNLFEIAKVEGDVVDVNALQAAGLVKKNIQFVKVVKSGEVSRAVTVKGLKVTKGAREAIEAAGGKVED